MPKFSEVEWKEGSVMDILQERSFFPYSGEDGDLFRKHGLAGWRVSYYGIMGLIKIQRKGRYWRGHQYWNTKRRWGDSDNDEDLTDEEIAEFERTLDNLIETGELPEDAE